jgi:hypothetical protein
MSSFSDLGSSFPPVSARVIRRPPTNDATAKMFGKHQNDGEWPNVGNSCRQALQSFIQEWREYVTVPIDEAVKAGDVKEIIRAAYRHVYKRGRFRSSLLAVLEGVWDHAQSVVHRESTTKPEAERLFVWVCLSLLELDRAVTELTETARDVKGAP